MNHHPNSQTDLLITGFGPFPRMPRNPSARLAMALARDAGWQMLGLKVRGEVLKVGYGIVAESLRKEASQPPRAMLMFGVAGRSREVRIEVRALNRVSRNARDATRAIPVDARLEKHGTVFRPARAPVVPMRDAMRGAHVPTHLSRSAGRYVCNAAYWHALGAMPRETRVLFVHIPMLMVPGTRKRDGRPDFAKLLHGARNIARALVLQAKRSTPL